MHPRLPENVLLFLQENVPVDQQRNEKEETGVSQICSFKELYDKLPGKLSKNMSKNLSVSIAFVCILHLANEKVSFVPLGVPLKADGNYRYFYKGVANPSLVLPIMAYTGRLLSKGVPFFKG